MPTFPITKRRNDALAGTRLDPTDPLNEGLVGLWDFNYGDDVNVFDQSAFGNHGKWFGSTINRYVPGLPIVGGLTGTFNDVNNDYVKASHTYVSGFPFSMSIWMFNDIVDANATLFCIGTDSNNRGSFNIKVRTVSSTVVRFTVYADYLGTIDTLDPDPLNTDVGWNHACIVVKSSVSRILYINGINVGESNVAVDFHPDITNGIVTIGCGTLRGIVRDFTLAHSVDDVRLYKRALTLDEIKSIYNDRLSIYKKSRSTTSFIGTEVPVSRITFPITKRRNDALAGTRIDPTSSQAKDLIYLWDFNYGDDVQVPNQGIFRGHSPWSGSSSKRYAPGPPRLGGQAANFVYTNFDEIDCGDIYNDTLFDQHITATGWMLFPINDNTYRHAFGIQTRGFYIGKTRSGVQDGKVRAFIQLNTASSILYDDKLPVVDKWYHTAMTWSLKSHTVKFYIDGNLVDQDDTGSGEFNLFTNNFYIGRSADNMHWDGLVSDVRIYGRELSVEEVRDIYFNPQDVYKQNFKSTSFIGTEVPPAISPTPWHLFNISS